MILSILVSITPYIYIYSCKVMCLDFLTKQQFNTYSILSLFTTQLDVVLINVIRDIMVKTQHNTIYIIL
jgi:hypothetical protein